jgi:uncharacterized membrane protein
MKVRKSRSLIKAITWRVIATINTFIVLLIMTGELSLAAFASGWTTLINFISYYYHERAWNKTDWGRLDKAPK